MRVPNRYICAVLACGLVGAACSGGKKGADSPTLAGNIAGTVEGNSLQAGTVAAGTAAAGEAGAVAVQSADGGQAGAASMDAGALEPIPDVQRCKSDLPRVQEFDEARAAHGEALLRNETLAGGVFPEVILRNLWVAWGTLPPTNDAAYWAQARQHYGMVEAPFDNGGLPLGMRREGSAVTFDCMICHSGRIAGQTILGAANGMVDLETFYDDLLIMRDKAPMFGFPQPPVPYDLDGLTYAVGAQDAFGLGFQFAGTVTSSVHTDFGPQKAPAFWLLQYKTGLYADGAGDAAGHHSMMATLVAFGITPAQLSARDEDFLDIAHYIRKQEPPCWTFTELDADKLARGKATYAAECASCHGTHSGDDAQFPNLVNTLDELDTDPMRAEHFGNAEAQLLNASWFGQPPFEPTGGYLAQPLAGLWARAPYFHNGSVPDLLGVLDARERPVMWRRLGTELTDYDLERVGVRYEEVTTAPDPNTREGRLVYDTTREAMGSGGHLYGTDLSDNERADLLEYLRSL